MPPKIATNCRRFGADLSVQKKRLGFLRQTACGDTKPKSIFLKKRQKDEKKRLNGKHLKTAVTVPKGFVVGCYPKSCLCIAGEVCGRSACVLRERSVVLKFNEIPE